MCLGKVERFLKRNSILFPHATRGFVFCTLFCFLFKTEQTTQNQHTHILTHTLTVYSYEFPLKGREGGPVQNFDNKDLSNGD
jgi:hypothetical protein